jgi:HEAT repeat protein
VVVEGERLSIDVRDAELEQVLQDIASRAGFTLATSGQLGRVTAAFDDVPLEQGLRRLARDNELVFVYGRPERGSGGHLAEVRVFGATAREAPADPESASDVDELLQRGDAPGNTARLSELLGSAPDSDVRARAAWALGRIGGADAETALTGALSDQSSDVRVQALYALQRVAGIDAIPAIQGALLRDSDVVVRRAAARTLGVMREPPATDALRAAAEDPDPTVRREVSRALRRHGVNVP